MTTTYDKVTYTNLAPGTYMLKVKAVNSDGYGGDEEASLKIVIYPPFWRSVWAYICLLYTSSAEFESQDGFVHHL